MNVAALALAAEHEGGLVTNIVDGKAQIRPGSGLRRSRGGRVICRWRRRSTDELMLSKRELFANTETIVVRVVDEGASRLDCEERFGLILWRHGLKGSAAILRNAKDACVEKAFSASKTLLYKYHLVRGKVGTYIGTIPSGYLPEQAGGT